MITAVPDREHRRLREVGGGLTDTDVTACLRGPGSMPTAPEHVDVG